MTATLDAVTARKRKDKPEPSAEQMLAEELVARARRLGAPTTYALTEGRAAEAAPGTLSAEQLSELAQGREDAFERSGDAMKAGIRH
jgi:hypothetical protein